MMETHYEHPKSQLTGPARHYVSPSYSMSFCCGSDDSRSCLCDGSNPPLYVKDEEDSTVTTSSASSSASRSSSFSSTSSTSTSTFSSMDLHYLYDQDQYPSAHIFDSIVQDYLRNLSCKKRDKALVDQQRYGLILQVLKDPRNTAISTAQFRFWVKKMFQLLANEVVCHDDKPVAIQEQIYPILIRAHRDAHHGGRDKTSALVRKQYSWIPKELIARFVRKCPFCISRRNGHPNRQMSTKKRLTRSSTHTTAAASIATSAAATAVSAQWMGPATPFYYYSPPDFPPTDYSSYLGEKPMPLPYTYDYYYKQSTPQDSKSDMYGLDLSSAVNLLSPSV